VFAIQNHEELIAGPSDMIVIPAMHYCIIKNPVLTDDAGKLVNILLNPPDIQ
jgi:hypothetical protein